MCSVDLNIQWPIAYSNFWYSCIMPVPVGCILPQLAPILGFLFIRSTNLMIASGYNDNFSNSLWQRISENQNQQKKTFMNNTWTNTCRDDFWEIMTFQEKQKTDQIISFEFTLRFYKMKKWKKYLNNSWEAVQLINYYTLWN